jgi:glycosyltransferase involved in cell wall biosynthesis
MDVSAALAQGAGVSRYIRELLSALLALDDAPDITLFNNRRPNQRSDTLPERARALHRIESPQGDKLWRARLLFNSTPALLKSALTSTDVFHAADVVVPALPVPIVITVHDMTTWLFPQHHSRLNRWYLRVALPMFVRRATRIITVSQSTKNDLIRLAGVIPEKIQVIYLGVDHQRFAPRPIEAARQHVRSAVHLDSPYFLSVGTLEPRKNLVALLYAFSKSKLADAGYKLVLTGMKGWHIDALYQALNLDANMARSVVLTGYLSDDLLPDLFAASTAFVYPSKYEGFGLPVLEAMACGAPVITSNTSSLPEVAGDAALLVNPNDTDAIAQAMRSAAFDTSQTATLRKLAFKQASRFTWKDTAERTRDVYRLVVADGITR